MTLLPPSPKTRKRIQESLYQDPDVTAQDLTHLKDWLSKQPHLPPINDDVFLERFLYGCKYRLPRCKETLDMYYTVRGAVPELYGNRDPLSRELVTSAETIFFCTMPKHTPEGYRVTFTGLTDADSQKFNFPVHVKYGFMLIDVHLKLESWCGDVIVIDLKNVSLGHVAKLSPVVVKKCLLCLQNAFPFRIKGIHFVNAPVYVDQIVSMVKPFLKKKLKERVHVHTGIDTLYDFIPKDMLPNEYGGKEGTVKDMSDAWKKVADSHRDWFVAEETRIADETKRPGKTLDCNELFGMEGSFRKLIID